jgi:hypothetical protein
MRDNFLFSARRRPWFALSLVALIVGSFRGLSAADDAGSGVEADFQSRFAANSDLASGGGTISQAYESLDLSLPVAGSEANGLGVEVIGQRLQFHFANFNRFLPGRAAPLSGASVVTLQPTVILTPARSWSLIGSGLVQEAGADHAASRDSTLWGGSVAAAYQASATLKLGVGIEVEQRMKASALVLPYPIIDWHISDRWSLASLDGETGRLAYACNGAWSIFGQLEFLSQDIRLRPSSSIPSGILRSESYPLSLGVQWKPRPRLAVSGWVGQALDASYQFEDRNGRLLRASGSHEPLVGTIDLDCKF